MDSHLGVITRQRSDDCHIDSWVGRVAAKRRRFPFGSCFAFPHLSSFDSNVAVFNMKAEACLKDRFKLFYLVNSHIASLIPREEQDLNFLIGKDSSRLDFFRVIHDLIPSNVVFRVPTDIHVVRVDDGRIDVTCDACLCGWSLGCFF